MLFHTWTFAVFFAIFFLVYLAVKNTRLREPWILTASYIFYGWWSPLYLLLIIYSTTVDYFGARAMGPAPKAPSPESDHRPPSETLDYSGDGAALNRRRRLWLILTIASNLLLLSLFKYGGFLADNLNALLGAVGIWHAVAAPKWLLPVGLSFYTFQSMSYTIDCYRGRIQPERSYLRFATFVSFFPQLVAGPIIRASDLLPQLRSPRRITSEDIGDGLSLFVVGLFKKMALADFLAVYVDKVYAAPGRFQAPALALATVAFAWQIYFDFSGYTDMARGVARIMGFRFMRNFNHPYLATSLGDFWGRWHISLSTWFRDYVYVPLGGNRNGEWATYRNMCLTMLISGLWHGAAWTYVIWGALHAAGRVATRSLEHKAFYASVPAVVKQALVFGFVAFTWIFFRARGLDDAWLIVTRIFSGTLADPRFPMLMLALIGMVWAYQFIYESRLKPLLQIPAVRVAMIVLMVLYVATVPGGEARTFIYFQF